MSRDTQPLAELEARLDYVVAGMTETELANLARLGLLVAVVFDDNLTSAGRATFSEVLKGIGPDFLLAFRALRQQAKTIIRHRKNWRTRT